MAFVGNMGHRHSPRPLLLQGQGPGMALSSSKGLNISMVSDAAQATQTRLLITTLVSLLPPLFIVHKLFCFILLLFHRHLPTTYLVTVVVLIYGMWLWTGPLWCLSCQAHPARLQTGTPSTLLAPRGCRLKYRILTQIFLAPCASCVLCSARNF